MKEDIDRTSYLMHTNPGSPAKPLERPSRKMATLEEPLVIPFPLRPVQKASDVPKDLTRRVQREYAARYLEALGASPSAHNVNTVLRSLPIDSCRVIPTLRCRGHVTDVLYVETATKKGHKEEEEPTWALKHEREVLKSPPHRESRGYEVPYTKLRLRKRPSATPRSSKTDEDKDDKIVKELIALTGAHPALSAGSSPEAMLATMERPDCAFRRIRQSAGPEL
eukprot:scaffold1525_cov254-Pinguiococcus_pyrenoidosus.AAC.3